MACLTAASGLRFRVMLKLKRLRKAFGDLVAVDDLSLEIKTGEVFGLLGPNGAGKTTTINMIVGLLAPDRGSIVLDGKGAPTDRAMRAMIGAAPQALSLYEELSAEENVTFFGRLYGLSSRHLAERVRWSLDFVELTNRRGDRVVTFSGGMKRRLNLAVALVHDPPLLLLDEPTVGVDPQSRNAIFENILALRKGGRTIIYTTHYMEEAERLCDRVGIIDHGKLIALDTVEALIASHGGKNVLTFEQDGRERMIETDDPLTDLSRLREQGEIERFRVDRPDLERVFLNLTGRHLRD